MIQRFSLLTSMASRSHLTILFSCLWLQTAYAQPGIPCDSTANCPASLTCVNGFCLTPAALSSAVAPLPSLTLPPGSAITSPATATRSPTPVSSSSSSSQSPEPTANTSNCSGLSCTADNIRSGLSSPGVITGVIIAALVLVAVAILICCRCGARSCCFGGRRKSNGTPKETRELPLNASVAVVTNDQQGRRSGPAPLPSNYSRPADLMRDVVKEERIEMIPLDSQSSQRQGQQASKSRTRYPSPHVPLLPPAEGYGTGPFSAPPLPSQQQLGYPYVPGGPQPPPGGIVVRGDQPRASFQEAGHSLPRNIGQPPLVPLLPPVQQHAPFSPSAPPGPILAAKTSPPRGKGYFGFWDPYGYFRQGYRDEHGSIHYGIFDEECRFHFGGVGASEPIEVVDEDMARDVPLPDQLTVKSRTESSAPSLKRQQPHIHIQEQDPASHSQQTLVQQQAHTDTKIPEKQFSSLQRKQPSPAPVTPLKTIQAEETKANPRRESFGAVRIGGMVGSPHLSSQSPYPGSGHPLKHELPWVEHANPVSAAAAALLAQTNGVPFAAYTASMDAYDGGGSHRDSFGGDYDASHGFVSTSLPRPPPTFPVGALQQPESAQVHDETAF